MFLSCPVFKFAGNEFSEHYNTSLRKDSTGREIKCLQNLIWQIVQKIKTSYRQKLSRLNVLLVVRKFSCRSAFFVQVKSHWFDKNFLMWIKGRAPSDYSHNLKWKYITFNSTCWENICIWCYKVISFNVTFVAVKHPLFNCKKFYWVQFLEKEMKKKKPTNFWFIYSWHLCVCF